MLCCKGVKENMVTLKSGKYSAAMRGMDYDFVFYGLFRCVDLSPLFVCHSVSEELGGHL